MRHVAILTDFGTSDSYNGIMEGVIRGICPQAKVSYIAPNVTSWSVVSGAYLLLSAFKYFPKNTVFLVVVDPGVGTKRRAVVIRTQNYFFVGPDNGVLYPAAKSDGIRKVYEILNKKVMLSDEISYTFHGRDVFSPVAALLACKMSPETVGPELNPSELTTLELEIYSVENNCIKLKAIHVDKYGNVALSLRPKNLIPGREVKIRVGKRFFDVKTVRTFGDVNPGERLLYVNSFGFLELAINQGNAAYELGISTGDEVCVEPCSREDFSLFI